MNFGAIKNIVGAVAPTLGTALAGPLGGTAAQAISAVLGCKNDPKSISTAMQQATPEQLAEIKKAELDFEAQMKKMDVDIFNLETADVQDARKAFKGDWTPRVFGLFSLCGFLGYIFLVTIQPPDANSDTIVSLVLGYLGGLVSGISSFYFGASHKKDD
jgi:hypothetical protein|tara:strand:+ start:244 stop:720 length:477 start_codon:yes stop_codon:yes gene_type:complete